MSGSKLWLWRYRYRFAGKPRELALGPYPEVSLKEARQRRDEARARLRDGVDPGVERKRAKLIAELSAANTFGTVAEEYIEQSWSRASKASVTIDKNKFFLRHFWNGRLFPSRKRIKNKIFLCYLARRSSSWPAQSLQRHTVSGRQASLPFAMQLPPPP